VACAGLAEAAERAGLNLALSDFGVPGDILPTVEPDHASLEFARVTTEDQLLAHAHPNSSANGMPLEADRDGPEVAL
jgi:hypothetical protein